MAKKQTRWHYVLVMTDNGPKFVTRTGEHKQAYWEDTEKPEEFSQTWAEEIAFGLTVNGITSFAVCTRFELDTQPYRYGDGRFKWEYFEKGEDEDGTADD